MNRKLFKNSHFIILLLILFVALFVRIINLSNSVNYDFDQEYASMFASSVVNEYPIRMIGQGLSVQGLFMGPWYFYYLTPFFIISGMHPIGGYVGSVVVGIAIVFSYFYVGKQFFGEKVGLILAAFRALLFNALIADWSMAPSYSSELVLILILIFLYKFWHGSKKAIMPLAFLAGLFTSIHPILFPTYFLILLIVFIKRKNIALKWFILSILLFLLPIVPLLAFEYLRNYAEFKQLLFLNNTNRSEEKNLGILLDYLRLVFYFPYNYLRLPDIRILRILLSTVILCTVIIAMIKKIGFWKNTFHSVVVLAFIFFTICYYFILPIHASDYYFLGANLVFLMYVIATFAAILSRNHKKISSLLVLVGLAIVFINLKDFYNHLKNPIQTLGSKDAIVKKIVSSEGNNSYNVGYDLDFGWQYGYGELFRYYDRKYQTKPQDTNRKNNYTISSSMKKEVNQKLILHTGSLYLFKSNTHK